MRKTAMKKVLVTSCATLWTLTLAAGCDGGGSHAVDTGVNVNKDTGTERGTDTGGGGGGGGTDAGVDTGGGGGGGGTDAGACTPAGTCGGTIVGAWNITASCLTVDVSGAVPDYCPTATAQPVGIKLEGTISYQANLTYSKRT